MIRVHNIEGRIRIKTPLLKQQQVLDDIKEVIELSPGIKKIETNIRTGSFLVEYVFVELPLTLCTEIEQYMPELRKVYIKHGDSSYAPYKPYVEKLRELLIAYNKKNH